MIAAEVVLRTADQERLAARWWEPEQPTATGVVLVHGFTGSKDDPDLATVADRLVADGHLVLSYDARGHGASSGVCTLGNDEHLDVAAAVERIRERVERVVAVGASMGAIAVVRHAAAADDLDGVVAVSGPAMWRVPRTLRSALAALITQTALGRRVIASRAGVRVVDHWERSSPPVDLVGGIAAPVAVVHGTRDRFLLPREARELHGAAAEPRRLLMVEHMGHAYDEHAAPAIADAVRWALEVGR